MQVQGVPDLQKISPLSRLPALACRFLQTRLRRVVIPANRRLNQHGERGSFLAILSQGQVDLLAPSGNILTLGPGQVFGVGIHFHGLPGTNAVITRTEAVLWVILHTDWQAARTMAPTRLARPAKKRSSRAWRRALVSLVLIGLAVVILGATPVQTTHSLVARMAWDAGRPDLAESYLRLAAYVQPGYSRIFDALGYSMYLQGKEAEALKVFFQAVSLDADNASAQNNLGVALLHQDQVRGAIEHIQVAVDLDPGSPEAYFNLGNAYLANGDLEAAVSAYRWAFDRDPDQLDAKALWAGIILKKNQIDAARHAWEQVLAADPGHALSHRGLGVIAVLEGQPGQALPHLKAALVASPHDAVARLYLGLALKDLGRPDDAAVEFGAALASSSDPSLSELAKIYLLQTLK